MKRCEQLETLSWEHHDALKFARNIRKGLENGTTPESIANYVCFICEQFLEPHFDLEERSLLMRMTTDQQQDWSVRQVVQEHAQFRQLKHAIEKGSGNRVQMLTDFVAMLKSHVKLEEHWFFPYCESILNDDELEAAAAEINRGHVPGDFVWENRFWKS